MSGGVRGFEPVAITHVFGFQVALGAFKRRQRNDIGVPQNRSTVKVVNSLVGFVLRDEIRVGAENHIQPWHERGYFHIVLQFEIEYTGVPSNGGDRESRFARGLAWVGSVVNARSTQLALTFE